MSLDALHMVRTLIEKGALEEAHAVASSALEDPHNPLRGEALLALAAADSARGHYTQSLRLCVEAGEVFEASGSVGGLCDALTQTAGVLRAAGDASTALSTLEHAETIARQSGDAVRIARVLRLIGVCASSLGRHQHALSCLNEAEQRLRDIGDHSERRKVQLSLLNARDLQNESEPDPATVQARSRDALQAWIDLAEEAAANQETRLSVLAWGNHAIALYYAGLIPEAIAALSALLPRYREFGMKANEGLTHVELARCREAQGDWHAAREQHQLALGILRSAGVQDDLMQSLDGLSRCEEHLGNPAAALSALRELRAIEQQRKDDTARQAVVQRELRVELARLTDAWARQAQLDPLTGLANRRALDSWFDAHWPSVERGRSLALLLLDLDRFKLVNDRHGHAVGDAVLTAVGEIVRRHAPAGQLAVRYGGEEFLLMLAGVDRPTVAALAQQLREAVERHPWAAIKPGLAVTTSVGVADAGEVLSAQALLALADRRLYAAKYHGRNRVVGSG